MTLDCPAHIEFLLWCHSRAEPYPKQGLEIFEALTTRLLNGGIIEPSPMFGVFKTTDKGAAWIALLCSTPEPKVAFVDEQGRVIK